MHYYQIEETLRPCSEEDIRNRSCQFAAILTPAEWDAVKDSFGMGIDMGVETGEPMETRVMVNMDSLTGTVCRPKLSYLGTEKKGFSFALDETGIVLIDDSDYVYAKVEKIRATKKWRLPGMERFLYDLLENVIGSDLAMLEGMEHRLNRIEETILTAEDYRLPPELNEIRGDLLDLRIHYEQLIDLGQELQENENGFFRDETLRYFDMFTQRVMRLQSLVSGQRDYVIQLRDLIQTSMDIRMNHIMTVLTVITSIFLPLTLIAGWYGMNFTGMPELTWEYGYPMVIVVSIVIVLFSLNWFKKKKWL